MMNTEREFLNPCSKSERELLWAPPTNVSMQKGSVQEHLPISSLNGGPKITKND